MRRHTFIGAMLIALAAVLPSGIWAPVASAHGGLIAVRTTAGSYQVEALVSRADKLIDEEIRIRVVGSKEVVSTAVVMVSLMDAEGATIGVYPARFSGSAYEVRYPPATGDGWKVTIAILGPQGTEVVEHPFKAPAREWIVGSGLTGVVLNVVSVLIMFVGLPLLAYRAWFRQPPTTGSTPPENRPGPAAEG